MHAYDQRKRCSARARSGWSWRQTCPEIETLLVATGGGGLIGGIAAWYRRAALKSSCRAGLAPTLHDALKAGSPRRCARRRDRRRVAAPRQVGGLMFPIAQKYVRGGTGRDEATATRNACCGTFCASLRSRAAPPRSPRSFRAAIARRKTSASQCCCAAQYERGRFRPLTCARRTLGRADRLHAPFQSFALRSANTPTSRPRVANSLRRSPRRWLRNIAANRLATILFGGRRRTPPKL